MINVRHGNGVAIDIDRKKFLLDPLVTDFVSFVSHAHLDHVPKAVYRLPYATEETRELIKVRDPTFNAKVVDINTRYEEDDFSFELMCANHILGSAQIYLEVDDVKILYTGDFKVTPNKTTKRLKMPDKVDYLIIESTYGKPEYVFPDEEDVISDFLSWIDKKIFIGKKVAIGVYPLGKAQEIIKILNEHGIEPKASALVEKYNDVYRKFGVRLKTANDSEVIVKSMHEVLNRPLNGHANAVVTGWALTENFGDVVGFPLSDHADFNQLLEYVARLNPKTVYVTHGFVEEFTEEIKKRLGINAIALKELKLL